MGKRKISVSLDPESINQAIRELNDYKEWFEEKCQIFLSKLAEEGMTSAIIRFQNAVHDGGNDVRVEWEERGENLVAVVARGHTVLFIEFGSGVRYPDSHPEVGVDPSKTMHGTWSESDLGKGHWKNPKGWYYAHNQKSYGNPANECMYQAKRDLINKFEKIARRVFTYHDRL